MKKINRQLVHEKYDGHCAYCGIEINIKDMQVDHLVSKLIFSLRSNKIYTDKDLNDIDNLMPSCRVCNKWKSAHSLEQFRKEINQQLSRLNEYNTNFRFAKKYGLIQETPHQIVFYFEKE
jgi:5-methylcytosine-specific restriction endonuclease McrA